MGPTRDLFILLLLTLLAIENAYSSNKCDVNSVGVSAYKDGPKWTKKPPNGSYIHIKDIPGAPRFVIIERQTVPNICKEILDKIQLTEMLFFTKSKVETVESAAFSDMKRLISIDLSHNSIKKVPHGVFNDLRKLVYLDLSSNKITSISSTAFNNMRSLKEISLSKNELTSIDSGWFMNCEQLSKLEFRKNRITHLNNWQFINLDGSLELWLDLAQNRIAKIAPGAFGNVMKFLKLDLHRNRIKHLPPFRELRKKGGLLNLRGNPTSCFSNDTLKTLSHFEKIRLKRDQFVENCTFLDDDGASKWQINFQFN